MKNKKDKWITPDGRHFQDVLELGRCLWCGGFGQIAIQSSYGETYKGYRITGCADHLSLIKKHIDELTS